MDIRRHDHRLHPGIGPLELIIVLRHPARHLRRPKRLPGLGRQLGSGMREFKDSITGARTRRRRRRRGADRAPSAAAALGPRPSDGARRSRRRASSRERAPSAAPPPPHAAAMATALQAGRARGPAEPHRAPRRAALAAHRLRPRVGRRASASASGRTTAILDIDQQAARADARSSSTRRARATRSSRPPASSRRSRRARTSSSPRSGRSARAGRATTPRAQRAGRAARAARRAAAAAAPPRRRPPKRPVTLGVAEPFTTTLARGGLRGAAARAAAPALPGLRVHPAGVRAGERRVAMPLMLMVPFLFIAGVVVRLLRRAAAGDRVPAELQRRRLRHPHPGEGVLPVRDHVPGGRSGCCSRSRSRARDHAAGHRHPAPAAQEPGLRAPRPRGRRDAAARRPTR